jgi:hypothetical protein
MSKIRQAFLLLCLLSVFQNAYAEPRHYTTVTKSQKITLHPDYTVSYINHLVFDIIDGRGLIHANRNIPIDHINELLSFEATVTHMVTGKVIKRYRPKDLMDKYYGSSNSIYSGQYIKQLILDIKEFPVRVEIIEERLSKSNFFVSSWDPQFYYHQKIRSAALEVTYPEEIGLRYKLVNLDQEPISSQQGQFKTLKWELNNLEPFDENSPDNLPSVILAPVNFALEGKVAKMDSWEGLGDFILQLNKNKEHLPENFAQKVRAMTKDVEDPFSKMEILYKYLQKNYRYVAIYYGIGGWEPLQAEEVVKNQYGECKALSILMKAMLKEVGIEAQYSLVYAGKDYEPLDLEFPMNSFNHAFLRVPIQDEVFWLECTSTIFPPGFSGSFTIDRPTLVIDEKGSYLDKTPDFRDYRFNKTSHTYQLQVNPNGNAVLSGNLEVFGFQAMDFLMLQQLGNADNRQTYLNKNIGGSGVSIENFDIQLSTEREVPIATIQYTGEVQRLAQQTAKRIIIPTHWKKLEPGHLPNDVLYLQEEVSYQFEEKPRIESGAENWEIIQDDFSYSLSTEVFDDKIIIKKLLQIKLDKDLSTSSKQQRIAHINQVIQKNIILLKDF